LSGQGKISRCNFLAEGADGREGDYKADAKRLQSCDIGSGGDGGGWDCVAFAMTSEERD
jgi:hypothetical protein